MGSEPAIDNDVAALSVAAGVSEKGTALVVGSSVIADVGERTAVANSTLEMPSRETVKSHTSVGSYSLCSSESYLCCGTRP